MDILHFSELAVEIFSNYYPSARNTHESCAYHLLQSLFFIEASDMANSGNASFV
jgi:hypothetical protein